MTKEAPAKAPVAWDMSSLDVETHGDMPVEIELHHPADRSIGLGMFVTIRSSQGATFKQYMREKTNDEMRENFEAKVPKNAPPTIEDGEKSGIEALVVCTVGWRGITWDGQDFPFTPANAIKLYTERSWIRPQIDRATGELKRFMKT